MLLVLQNVLVDLQSAQLVDLQSAQLVDLQSAHLVDLQSAPVLVYLERAQRVAIRG